MFLRQIFSNGSIWTEAITKITWGHNYPQQCNSMQCNVIKIRRLSVKKERDEG